MNFEKKIKRNFYFYLIPGIIMFTIVIIFPYIMNLYLSFTKWSGVGMPQFKGIDNYLRAFHDIDFWSALKNNALLIISMTIIPTIIGLLLAVFLFQYIAINIGKGVANFFKAGFYLPQIIPAVIVAVSWKWIFQPNWGALNTILTKISLENLTKDWLGDPVTALGSIMLVMIWFQIGYPLVIFISGLQRIDPEIYESASIDGARGLKLIQYITLPQIKPELYVVILTTIIHAMKIFGPIYALTQGGPGNSTLVASYFSFKNFFEISDVGYGATMATILSLIIIFITIIYIRIQSSQDIMGE